MPTWDELFKSGATFEGVEAEVARLATLIQATFNIDPREIMVWDIGCGTGRHAAYFARLGFKTYASDNSPTALAKTKELVETEGNEVTIAEADMEESPFENIQFHGVVIWNVMQHATSEKIRNVLTNIEAHLLPDGYIVLSVKSTNAEEVGQGEKMEEGTYVMADGPEAGVPHHYFSKEELETILAPLNIIHFVEVQEDIFAVATSRPIATKKLPYHNAHWVVIGQKPEIT
ncbi:MAG TPA: methyltransferase domain-containing protein [Candidatus Lokiarchaeia archaeon]|nr:methyltransferase domain-containing protein [Candidatus Lokiarchaeia archaeon]